MLASNVRMLAVRMLAAGVAEWDVGGWSGWWSEGPATQWMCWWRPV